MAQNLDRTISFGMALAAGLLLGLGGLNLHAQAPAVVDLKPGECPTVHDGDTLTFLWNPAFSALVSGLQEFELGFAHESEVPYRFRVKPQLLLIANPRQHGQLPGTPESEIAEANNGYFQMRFSLSLRGIAAGRYLLVEAEASPRVPEGSQGPQPVMMNNPAQGYYCLNVEHLPGRRV